MCTVIHSLWAWYDRRRAAVGLCAISSIYVGFGVALAWIRWGA